MVRPEARRSARVAAGFLVAIDGVDPTLVPRKGDISATGIYFETDKPVGTVGTIQWLHVASSNRAREIRLMAHVVRAITLDDLSGRRAFAVALAFMPESDDAAAAVERFVQYVLLLVDDPITEPHLSPRLAARALAPSQQNHSTVVRQLSVRSMTLEASWSVGLGEHIRVDIAAPGMSRRVRLEGSAVRVVPVGTSRSGPPYEIEVEFQTEIARPHRHGSSMTFPAVRPEAPTAPPPAPPSSDDEVSRALDDLFSALIHPPSADPARPTRGHLSGLLSSIPLPTLCALFDMERLSGKLTLQRKEERFVVYVCDGRLVDVEGMPAGVTPRAQIGRLLAWVEGSFELDVHPVKRVDRIGVGTTELLMDLAREADEARTR
jgi:Domain of unknown function (DUF4388)